RGGATLAAVGGGAALVITALTGDSRLGIPALALFGLGLSVCLPCLISHAGRRAAALGRDSGAAMAMVASAGYIGVLAGPPLLGLLASTFTLPVALAFTLPAATVLVAAATLIPIRTRTATVAAVTDPAATDPAATTATPRRRPIPVSVLVAVATSSVALTLVGVQLLTALAPPVPSPPTSSARDAAAERPPIATSPAPLIPGVVPVAASVAIPSVSATIDLPGGTPGDVTLTPDRRQAWVAHREAGVLSVTDLATRAVVGTVAIPAGPARFIAFCAGRAWVSVYSVLPGGAPDDAAPHLIAVIDIVTLEQVATVPVGRRPFASSCTPDGTRLVVPSHDDGRLDVIDTTTLELTRSVPVAPNPHWVAVTSGGTSVWTANHESNVVTALTSDLSERAQVPVGASPHAVAVSPDDATVAVANFDGDSVSLIDAATAQVTATVAVAINDPADPSDDALDAEGGPQDLVWSADGRRVLTVDVYSGQVSVIDAGTGVVTATLPVPSAVGIAADDTRAYVTSLSASTLTVLDLTQETP
ncbi:MAG: beta-propeller fold lactonase family protein, partial [Pseudonocardia sp.]|nr:beta-propeller fold lactonase family protein [Pseudonocardia sp.]